MLFRCNLVVLWIINKDSRLKLRDSWPFPYTTYSEPETVFCCHAVVIIEDGLAVAPVGQEPLLGM